MSLATILLIAGGGAIGVKLLGDQKPPAPAKPSGSGASTAPTGARAVIKQLQSKSAAPITKPSGSLAPAGTYRDSAGPTGGRSQEELDAFERAAKAEFDALSGDAKTAACKELKKQFPNSAQIQALDCAKPTFGSMKAAAAAAGAAAGTALCGPACGAVAAVAATYAYDKLDSWWNAPMTAEALAGWCKQARADAKSPLLGGGYTYAHAQACGPR